MAFYAPRLYRYFSDTLEEIIRVNGKLCPNWDNSAFAACTFNCGPQTAAFDHKDAGNLSHGLCALTSLGKFNYHHGAHLVLFELRAVLEFPAGNTALIPSAAVTHANTRIQPNETRFSIAQYTAGGLFRWVAYGHKPVKDTPDSQREVFNKPSGVRWQEGLEMFSKYNTLSKDQTEVFEQRTQESSR